MGLFKSKEERTEVKYAQAIKPLLAEQDGKTHTVLIQQQDLSATLYFAISGIEINKDYTRRFDYLLTRMQDDGYEIISIDNEIASNPSDHKYTMYSAFITYK
ncbi:hypothetical protein ESZ50_10070 [Weissella muntiaci]|uniref:Uncharacterized protein n=1 Tax=Weissella muntiaci TaxID=2508881 RepID=A0A6C2C311_9LACO|nr:hypothetical protein [Weissella muntiaci]TYC48109.1 hypothetical protein ESZ50_10070 [Weissella muntiaci]